MRFWLILLIGCAISSNSGAARLTDVTNPGNGNPMDGWELPTPKTATKPANMKLSSGSKPLTKISTASDQVVAATVLRGSTTPEANDTRPADELPAQNWEASQMESSFENETNDTTELQGSPARTDVQQVPAKPKKGFWQTIRGVFRKIGNGIKFVGTGIGRGAMKAVTFPWWALKSVARRVGLAKGQIITGKALAGEVSEALASKFVVSFTGNLYEEDLHARAKGITPEYELSPKVAKWFKRIRKSRGDRPFNDDEWQEFALNETDMEISEIFSNPNSKLIKEYLISLSEPFNYWASRIDDFVRHGITSVPDADARKLDQLLTSSILKPDPTRDEAIKSILNPLFKFRKEGAETTNHDAAVFKENTLTFLIEVGCMTSQDA